MKQEETIFFELKESEDFLKIDLIGFAHPDAKLDWDRNWIKSKLTLNAGGFSGRFDCDIMTTDFERFKEQLSELYEKLEGTAIFETREDQVAIRIEGDGIGHFQADCMVMDFPGTGNKLEFELTFDQTFIPDLLRQLKAITQTFPKQGSF